MRKGIVWELVDETFYGKKRKIIYGIAKEMKSRLSRESSGHDWWHAERVLGNGIKIAKGENADSYIVALASLTHDIADYKFHGGDEEIGPIKAGGLLGRYSVGKKRIEDIQEIIRAISYKGQKSENKTKTIEGMCAQDADRLDAIGAIGIARCFAFGGYAGNTIHDPGIKPNMNMDEEEYKKAKNTQINHFYEKLLLLKDMMNTKTGKKMAEERHKVLERFLEQFFKEWNLEI
jgi:uncharacterized protein